LAEELLAHVVGGILVFLAGIAVGYFGLPFKNAQRIAILETRMKAMENKVNEIHADLRSFIREWRNGRK